MPGPSAASLHVDQLLSDMAIMYENSSFIADEVSPIKEVTKRSDKYATYARRDRHTIPDDAIEPTSTANLAQWSTGSSNYSVEDHALADWVSKDEEDNADDPFSPLADAQEIILQQMLLGREARVANQVMAAANYASTNKVTLTTPWSDKINGTPIDDIEDGILALAEPNGEHVILVLGLPVWKALRRHPDILAACGKFSGAGGTGLASRAEVAAAFEIRDVVVGSTRYDSANQGQTASYGWVWGSTTALLARAPKTPKSKDVMLARTFRYRPAGQNSIQTATEFDRKRGPRGSTWVQNAFSDDEVIVAADVGYHFSNAAA